MRPRALTSPRRPERPPEARHEARSERSPQIDVHGGPAGEAGVLAGWPYPSRGAEAAKPIRPQRNRGEEDQRDPEIPQLLLGSDPVDDRGGGDPVGGRPALAGLRHHPAAAGGQRRRRFLGRAPGGQCDRCPEGQAGGQGPGETRRQVGRAARRASWCPATSSACAWATSYPPMRGCWRAIRSRWTSPP